MKFPVIAVKANIRKEKKQMAVIIILFTVAVFMMMAGIIMLQSFGNVFKEKSEEYNTADIYVAMKENVYDDAQKEWLDNRAGVRETEKLDVLYLEGATVSYNGAEMQIDLIVFPEEQKRKLNSYEIHEKDDSIENPVYVGLDFKNNGGYKVGDEISFHYMGEDYTYHIAGFVEDIYNGFVRNQMNTGIILPEDAYNSLEDGFSADGENSNGASVRGVILQAALEERSDSAEVLEDFMEYAAYSGQAEYGAISYTEVENYFNQKISIVAAILLSFAILLTVVVLFVIYFEIVDYYQTNMKNIGIMKAVGYTSGQLIQIQIWQFIVIAVAACIIGAVLCVCLYPSLSGMVVSSTWLTYDVNFRVAGMFLVPVLQLVLTILVTYLTNIRVKKMYPIEALELSGSYGKKITKNRYDMRKHRSSLNVMMAVKMFCRNISLNVFVGVVITIVTFIMGFILTLNYNVGYKPENIVNMLMYEYPDVQFIMNAYHYDEDIMDKIEEDDNVEQAIFFDIKSVKCQQSAVYAYVTDDFLVTRNNIVYEGRHPQTESEIAVGGKLAGHFNKKIGDSITIKNGEKEQEYEITGLIQTAVGNGFDCELTTDAYKKLGDDFVPYTGYVYAKDKENIGEIIDMLEEDYSDEVFSITNQNEMIDASMSTYISLVNMITKLFSVVTMIIIVIIMHITIRKIVFRQRKSLGIQKAVGFVSSDLIREMSGAFLPVLVLGCVAGTVCAIVFSNPLCTAIFSIMGIVKVNFTIYIPWMVTMGILVAVFSYLAMRLFLRKVKKLSAYQVLLEGK